MIYVSTSCLREPQRSVKKVLEAYAQQGIRHIELGASHLYEPGIADYLKKYQQQFQPCFTLHTYFPPEEDRLHVNLASANPLKLARSIQHLKQMIDLSKELQAECCSFHSGLRFDFLDNYRSRSPLVDYETAYSIFLDSLSQILKYAQQKGVAVAMEPLDVSKKFLDSENNHPFLICEPKELVRLSKDLQHQGLTNLHYLLDLGHLQVSAHNLKFDPEEYIALIKDKIIEIHVHDNDKVNDLHQKVQAGSWIAQQLGKLSQLTKVITLESGPLSIEEIQEQKLLLEKICQGGK